MNDPAAEVYRSLQVLVRALSAASSRDLHGHSDAAALTFIGDHPGCIVTDLAHALNLGMTTASSLVDRLVKKGLVARERQENNRRIVVLHLTAAGLHVRASSLDCQMELCRGLLQALSPAERPYFTRLIVKASDSIEKGR